MISSYDFSPKQIIYEDNHLLVVNKLPKQLVQGDKTNDLSLLELLKDYIKNTANKKGDVFLGLPHRLDRPCSGVVVYTKTSKSLERMNKIFREGTSEKIYWAITESQPPKIEDTLTNYLRKNEKQNKSYVVDSSIKDAKEAILKYKTICSSDRYTLLEIELITGRHHQIRCQLSNIGCSIKGDLKYGAKRSNKDGSINLHALSITFEHPVKKEKMQFIAQPPKDNLWDFFVKTTNMAFNK
jgi:23S rRNA pseudouridine1911/1915/1917 synthase